MVGLLDFRSHSKSRPFANQPLFDHLKSRLVQILDPHCTSNDTFAYLFKVEPALLEPLKVLDGPDIEPDEHVEDVSLVHVNSDQGLELDTFHFFKILKKL